MDKSGYNDNAVLHIKYMLSSDGATQIEYRIAQQQGALRMDWLLFGGRTLSDQADKFLSLGSKIYYYDEHSDGKGGLSGMRQLCSFFKTHPYRIVYCDTNTPERLSVLLAAMLAGVKRRVVHSHGLGTYNAKGLSFRLHRLALPMVATDLLACSGAAALWLFPQYAQKRVVLVKNGVDTRQWRYDEKMREQCRREHGWDDKFVVGHVARFAVEKNHRKTIEIFAGVYARNQNARLVLIGEGSLRAEIEQLVSDEGLTGAVLFTGVTDRVDEYMQAMDALVLPSLFEGLAMVAVEAQSVGLRCVLSDRVPEETAITDLVEFVPLEADAEQWTQAVLRCANTRPRRDTGTDIREAGYDIRAAAAQLVERFKK